MPAPAGLVGELYVQDPGRTWKELRDAANIALLPQHYGVLLTTVLGLPPLLADAFDDGAMTTGAATLDGSGRLQAVVGARVTSGKELVARLTTGSKASHDEARDASGMTLLKPKPGKASAEISLAVLGNVLLVAQSEDALRDAGPYVARTLPTKKPPAPGAVLVVPKEALRGALAKEVRARWKRVEASLAAKDRENRAKHGGRAPDFGDPAAALSVMSGSVGDWVKMLEEVESAQVQLAGKGDSIQLRLTVDPGASKPLSEWISGLSLGDARPLLALPRRSALGVLTRSTEEQRGASAKSTAAALGRLFGDRLKAPEQEKIEAALGDLARARGDEALFGLSLGATQGVVFRGPAGDRKAFDSAMKGMVGLLRMNAFREPLRQFVGDYDLKQSTTKIVGLDAPVQRVLLSVKPSAMRRAKDPQGELPATPQPVEALWTQNAEHTYGALAVDAPPLLIDLVAGEANKTWETVPGLATRLDKLGNQAGFFVVVRPAPLLGQDLLDAPGVVSLSAGRAGTQAVVDLSVDQAALAVIAQKAMR